MGNRVSKTKYDYKNGDYSDFVKTTYYVHEASGKQLATYEEGTNNKIYLKEVPLLGSARVGMDKVDIERSNTALSATELYYRTVGTKYYEITDHLGNVRAVIGDVKIPGTNGNFTADLKSYSNYYPFGMEQPERCYQSADYRYGYNGKEKDDEVKGSGNSYDYGARIYDPRVGQFLSMDPLMDKHPGASPYNYTEDNPIWRLDSDGRDWSIASKTVKNGVTIIKVVYKAAVVNQSSTKFNMAALRRAIESQNENSYSATFKTNNDAEQKVFDADVGSGKATVPLPKTIKIVLDAKIRVIKSEKDRGKHEHLYKIRDDSDPMVNGSYGAASNIYEKDIYLNAQNIPGMIASTDKNTIPHETGHTGGLRHPNTVATGGDPAAVSEGQSFMPGSNGQNSNNAMYSGDSKLLNDLTSTEINTTQFVILINNIKNGKVNKPEAVKHPPTKKP